MKTFGIGLIIFGIIWAIFVLNLDVSVPTLDGSIRVNNIGLISHRHNLLIIAGVIILAGVLLLVFGNETLNRSKSGYVPCPLCAEDIKAEAVICKYCHSPVAEARDRMSKAAHMNKIELNALISKISKNKTE